MQYNQNKGYQLRLLNADGLPKKSAIIYMHTHMQHFNNTSQHINKNKIFKERKKLNDSEDEFLFHRRLRFKRSSIVINATAKSSVCKFSLTRIMIYKNVFKILKNLLSLSQILGKLV